MDCVANNASSVSDIWESSVGVAVGGCCCSCWVDCGLAANKSFGCLLFVTPTALVLSDPEPRLRFDDWFFAFFFSEAIEEELDCCWSWDDEDVVDEDVVVVDANTIPVTDDDDVVVVVVVLVSAAACDTLLSDDSCSMRVEDVDFLWGNKNMVKMKNI